MFNRKLLLTNFRDFWKYSYCLPLIFHSAWKIILWQINIPTQIDCGWWYCRSWCPIDVTAFCSSLRPVTKFVYITLRIIFSLSLSQIELLTSLNMSPIRASSPHRGVRQSNVVTSLEEQWVLHQVTTIPTAATSVQNLTFHYNQPLFLMTKAVKRRKI